MTEEEKKTDDIGEHHFTQPEKVEKKTDDIGEHHFTQPGKVEKKITDIGEYHFTEPEQHGDYGHAESEPESSDSPTTEKQSFITKILTKTNKKFLIILFAVIALFVIFRVLKPGQTTQPTTMKPTVGQTTTEQTMAAAQLASASQQITGNSSKINQLQTTVSELQNKANSLANIVYALNDSVKKLDQNVLQLSSKLETKHVDSTKKRLKAIYHIRAIVPGRAWLETKDGIVKTIRQGKTLGKYGTVTTIDPVKGIVKTSKGYLISYGKDDS